MKPGITKHPLSVTVVLFSLLIGIFWFRHIVYPTPYEAPLTDTAPLGSYVATWLDGLPTAADLLSILFIYMTALVITRIVSRNLVFPTRIYTYIIILAITGCGLYVGRGSLPVFIAAYILAKASEAFVASFVRNKSFYAVFKAGLLLGLAPLFYAPAAIYILMMPFAMLSFMRSRRESVVSLAGVALPIFIYAYVTWASGGSFVSAFIGPFTEIVTSTGPGSASTVGTFIRDMSASGIMTAVTAILVAICTLMSVGIFMIQARSMRTRAFRVYLYMLMFLLISVAGFFIPCGSASDLPIAAIPVSIVATGFFSKYSGPVPDILYLLTMLLAVTANILQIIEI